MNEKKIRIAKIISHAGLCSRAEAEKLLKTGKVTINNKLSSNILYLKTESIRFVYMESHFKKLT